MWVGWVQSEMFCPQFWGRSDTTSNTSPKCTQMSRRVCFSEYRVLGIPYATCPCVLVTCLIISFVIFALVPASRIREAEVEARKATGIAKNAAARIAVDEARRRRDEDVQLLRISIQERFAELDARADTFRRRRKVCFGTFIHSIFRTSKENPTH